MAATFWVSYVLQTLSGIAADGGDCGSAFAFIADVNPEVLASEDFEDESGRARATGNALAVAKFCTESVPQSIFALLLARDLSGGPAQTVTYASVGLSLAIGLSGSKTTQTLLPGFLK